MSDPTIIPVSLSNRAYDIVIQSGALHALGSYLAPLGLGKRVLVVSNPVIFRHYGPQVLASLNQQGFETSTCLLPAGERYKTPASVQKIYDAALAHRLERSSVILALGGGVVGDMAGFAAATWLRGIACVQVPTSFLAMVDAAIGGKTGINHPQGKNLIGCFHQPRLVLIDPLVVETLPAREFKAALAEVIKYGVIWDTQLFMALEQAKYLHPYRQFSPGLLEYCLIQSCRAKAEVVAQDEREANVRALLNYGHTIGHAIESLTAYRVFNHGEAVALGMAAAGTLAVQLGWWSTEHLQRQQALIAKCALPTEIPKNLDPQGIVTALSLDKKVHHGKIRFVLPTGIGSARVTDLVTTRHILEAVQSLQAKR